MGASSKSESDLGDRMESAFNLSFWEKEGAFDWSWLGLDLVNERSAEDLLVSLEWQCYRESEQQLVHTFLDIPWPWCSSSFASIADVRSLRQRFVAAASKMPVVLSTGDRKWLFVVHAAH